MVDTSDQNAENEHFALTDTDPADREDVWQDMLSTLLLPMSVHIPAPSRNNFRGQLRRQWVDDLALIDCRTGTFTGRRHRHQLGTDADDFVAILLGVAGGENVNCADNAIRVRPSSGIAISGSHTFDFKVISNYHKRCLLVPNSALDDLGVPRLETGCVELRSAGPAVALLDSYLATLSVTLPAMSRSTRTAARNASLQLVAAAMNSEDGIGRIESTDTTPALRVAMDRWIDLHLRDANLTPDALAIAHAVSPRTVYRLFARDGETVGSVVRARRLSRAKLDLRDAETTVSTIASRWGFSDAGHFSRNFRETYGVTPSEYRATL
jgi:AraC family transcriptional activator of tynA and feaB